MRFDALLVHYLAQELDSRLAGVSARAIRLDAGSLTAALETGDGALLFDLHPARGSVLLGAAPPADNVMMLPRRARVARVSAPPDERLLVIELAGGAPTKPRRLVVELLGNQWNAVVLDGTPAGAADAGAAVVGGGRILAVARPRDAGGRRLRVGVLYRPPPPAGRQGTDAPVERTFWRTLLEPVPPPERAGALIRALAWMSPINAGAVLGSAGAEPDAAALAAAYDRYRALAELPGPNPCVLDDGRAAQPYPLPLPDRPGRPADSLLDAMALAAGATPPRGAAAPGISPELLEKVRRRAQALARRAERLRAQGVDAEAEAGSLRAQGDILLARLQQVHRGAVTVTLPDFSGGTVQIELDPALSPAENATRLYERARRRERAAARVPQLVAGAEAERSRLLGLLDRADAGRATIEELEAAAGPARSVTTSPEERLPYRRYRTSGGLEARVGRSRKDNDELTFHASSPGDVWLHARDAAGAHVILRWSSPEGAPPRRDLTEAAILAALHSRARTSGTVAVDWTRRKYVRKPRKAPPGVVIPERVRTIFVEPDERIERALRER